MPSSNARAQATSSGYRIGTVANLTGIDIHTIRSWERRYGAVEPTRSAGGTRLYDDAAVERLQLLKAFVDCGEPIRVAAALSDDELRDRLETLAGMASPASRLRIRSREPVRVAMLTATVDAQLRANPAALTGYDVVCRSAGLEPGFLRELEQARPEVLLVDLDVLGRAPLTALSSCIVSARSALVVVHYAFAPRLLLSMLAKAGVQLMRGPLRVEQLRRVLDDYLVSTAARRRHAPGDLSRIGRGSDTDDAKAEPRERRYDDAQLARLVEVSSALDCECPNHLATIAASLVA